MDNTKHTPGPWIVVDFNTARDLPHRLIADCGAGQSILTQQSGNLATRDQAEANARLIAASPEMYEALKMLVDEAKAFGFDSTNVNCFEMARQAISRVEGDL